jgi:RNA polymerase sigma-70 factor (ECF subfamily)
MRPSPDEPDDLALLRRVAHGDERALGALYDRPAGWLTVRLTRRCAMPDVVDHAVQDTFVAVWRKAGTYRGGGDVAAFIWGIGIRRLIDAIRKEKGARRRLPRRAAEAQVVISAEDQVLVGIEHGRLGHARSDSSHRLRGGRTKADQDSRRTRPRTGDRRPGARHPGVLYFALIVVVTSSGNTNSSGTS